MRNDLECFGNLMQCVVWWVRVQYQSGLVVRTTRDGKLLGRVQALKIEDFFRNVKVLQKHLLDVAYFVVLVEHWFYRWASGTR